MQLTGKYAGDVDVAHAYDRLSAGGNAVLIDVRTRAEWNFVGVPDLRQLRQDPVFLEWQSFPPAPAVTDFKEQLSALLDQNGVPKDAELYFLCRSGARSQSAAIALTDAGYSNCFNVAGGFEGALDAQGHRGNQNGWKAAGLPWAQS